MPSKDIQQSCQECRQSGSLIEHYQPVGKSAQSCF